MRLYKEDGHSFLFIEENVIGEGAFGKIYKLDDICYKIFIESLPKYKDNSEFSVEVFNILKKLNLKNFYQLYEVFYNKTLTSILGYSSKYYKNENIDIITMPTDYTLNNLYNMYDSIKKISELGILMVDSHDGNVIMNSKEITIIDTDLYYKVDTPFYHTHLLYSNIKSLLSLYKTLYYSSIDEHHDEDFSKYTKNVESIFNPYEKDAIDVACKKLIKYKYPIDYLRRK